MPRTIRLFAALLVLLLASGCGGGGGSDEGRTANAVQIPAPPDVAAPPADAVRTPTGLASKVLTPGTGTRHPRPNSQVRVHYTGWTTDGKMFDSSVARGEPITFGLDGVIPGWTEGVQMMVEGEKRRFWIPAKLAYEGGGGPPGMLVFDIELLKIES
jgi:peptidylprolyl isomerase